MSIFHLSINPDVAAGPGCFTVLAEYQGVQGPSLPAPVKFVPSSKLTTLVRRLHSRDNINILNNIPPRFMSYWDQEDACTLIGEELFKTFFVGQALDRYKQYRMENSPPRIALHLPPELYTYPWEVLRDGITDNHGQFFSTLGSLIRYDEEVGDEVLVQTLENLDFLFLLSTPQDKSGIGSVEPIDKEVLKFLKVKPATYEGFLTGLQQRHQGLVFYGHGEIKEEGGVLNGALIFEREEQRFISKRFLSDTRPAYTIGNAIGRVVTQPLTAFILACESAWVDTGVGFDRSIAGALLKRTNMAFVIAAQTPIDFLAGQEIFEVTLKTLIEKRLPLDLALGVAREAVRENLELDLKRQVFAKLDWWVPVLYARAKNFHILPGPDERPVRIPQEPLAGSQLLATKEPIERPLAEVVGVSKAIWRKVKGFLS